MTDSGNRKYSITSGLRYYLGSNDSGLYSSRVFLEICIINRAQRTIRTGKDIAARPSVEKAQIAAVREHRVLEARPMADLIKV